MFDVERSMLDVHLLNWAVREAAYKRLSIYKHGGSYMETYYKPEDLPKFEEIGKEAPELAKKFFEYYGAVFAEGELTEREKALIALAVAHTVQCPYCIDAYTQACLEKGSNLAEMTEAVHVVTAIRGGASLVHGIQMRNIAQKLSM
jgi:4-carboxymuconolactone decarboxylase